GGSARAGGPGCSAERDRAGATGEAGRGTGRRMNEDLAAKRGKALILGIPYFGEKLAADLSELGWEARYLPHPGRRLRSWGRVLGAVLRADVLYLVSSRIEKGSPQDWMFRLRRKPVVIHWVGTDVKLARGVHRKGRVSVRIAEKAHHWC